LTFVLLANGPIVALLPESASVSGEDGSTAPDAFVPNPVLTLADSGSSATFGPFASGTKIKLTQAPGATPGQEPGPGVIDWKIKIKGDGVLTATDASGNVSAPVSCKVAPKPK